MFKKKSMSSVGSVINYVSCQQYSGNPCLNKTMLGRRFDLCKRLHRKDLFAHYGCVNAIEFSNDGEWLVSGGDDKRVLIWNVDQALSKSPKPNPMKGEHNSNIFCLSFDASHNKLFSAGNDEQVILHDVETGETLDVFLHDEAVYGLSVDPVNESIFASACDDGRILLWDIRASTTDAFMLAGCSSAFHAVMYNPAEPRLISTANAKEGVVLWDVRKPRVCMVRYEGTASSQSAMSVRFNSTGTHLLALRRRFSPILYELHSAKYVAEFDHGEYYNSCTMKSCCFAGGSDQFILSGSDDFKLYMWKIPDGISSRKGLQVKEAHRVLRGHRSIVNQVRSNPAFGILASSGVEKIIKIWNTFPMDEQMESNSATDKDSLRKVYSHEEYINLVLESGQFMTHDYSHRSVQEDPRMMAFFDSLVQRDIEGWTSDSSETSTADTINMCFEVQAADSSTSASSSSDDDELRYRSNLVHVGQSHNTRDYAHQINFSMTLPPPEFAFSLDDSNERQSGDMTSERISQLIARKRNEKREKSERSSQRLKKRLKRIKKLVHGAANGSSSSTSNRGSVLENSRNGTTSTVHHRADTRKFLMKERAKLMKNSTAYSDTSGSDAEDSKFNVNYNVAIDLSVENSHAHESESSADEKPSAVTFSLSLNETMDTGERRRHPPEEKPNVANGSVMSRSNGSVDAIEVSNQTRETVICVPHSSTSGANGAPPLSVEPGCSMFLQPKSGKHHSRNYRKRSSDDMYDD